MKLIDTLKQQGTDRIKESKKMYYKGLAVIAAGFAVAGWGIGMVEDASWLRGVGAQALYTTTWLEEEIKEDERRD